MRPDYFHDTIAVISTPQGKGAIAIVRLSGSKAFSIAKSIFKHSKINFDSLPYYKIILARLIDPESKEDIDEVMIAKMPSDKSFTREDMVEIHCHGGEIIPYTILKVLFDLGARPAEAGEFTKRAYLNGRIDLTQAEAIHDLVSSQSKLAGKMALSHLEKRFSNKINSFKDQIVHHLAHMEVNIDYPEEDLEPVYYDNITESLNNIIVEINQILKDSHSGKIIKKGVNIAIVGKTNVGKSSLFNYFNREERAIVSQIHGTTRDFLESHIVIKDIPINLIDTAGFRQTEDEIESIGKKRAEEKLNEADHIIWLLDSSRDWDNDDDEVFNIVKEKKPIIILNKVDLNTILTQDNIKTKMPGSEIFAISVLQNTGLKELENGLAKIFLKEDFLFTEQTIICNLRQENLLNQSKLSLIRAKDNIEDNLSYEFIAMDLREALDSLGEIVGEVTTEDILNTIFSNFCIGK